MQLPQLIQLRILDYMMPDMDTIQLEHEPRYAKDILSVAISEALDFPICMKYISKLKVLYDEFNIFKDKAKAYINAIQGVPLNEQKRGSLCDLYKHMASNIHIVRRYPILIGIIHSKARDCLDRDPSILYPAKPSIDILIKAFPMMAYLYEIRVLQPCYIRGIPLQGNQPDMVYKYVPFKDYTTDIIEIDPHEDDIGNDTENDTEDDEPIEEVEA